jgi:hypothetical protein
MSYFSLARNVELSIIYFLETSVNSDWNNIHVVKAFNSAYKEELPVIAIYLESTDNIRKEIGSTELTREFNILIDIFATSNAQRIDLAYYIIDKLKDGCVYYIHSQTSGSPETLSRVADGRLFVTSYIADEKVGFSEDVDKYDRYRHHQSFIVKKSGG